MSTIVSFRINPEELAKALDGLITKGTDPNQLNTISQIVRTTFYYGIISLCDDPRKPASRESTLKINQLTNQNKKAKNVSIKDLMKGD